MFIVSSHYDFFIDIDEVNEAIQNNRKDDTDSFDIGGLLITRTSTWL